LSVELNITEGAKPPSRDLYTIEIDGLIVPLVQITIRRETGVESLVAVVPVFYEDIVLAGTLFEIRESILQPTQVNPDVSTIFSGSLSTIQHLANNSLSVECAGSASYPASVNRPMREVSYMSDSIQQSAIRARIDSRFYPGDTAIFDNKRVNVRNVVISVSQGASFMSVSDG
jgi:hypothetical protein